MKKKLIVIVFLLVLVLNLVGCSSKPENNTEKETIKQNKDIGIEDIEVIKTDYIEIHSKPAEGLHGVKNAVSGLWGYIDVNTGDYVIEPQFYKSEPFSEGLAAVQNREGFWGFINNKGELVIDYKFTGLTRFFPTNKTLSFNNGFSIVEYDSGDFNPYDNVLINNKGEIICDLKTLKTNDFVINYGPYLYKESDKVLYDSNLDVISKDVYAVNKNYYATKKDGKVEAFDFNGNKFLSVEKSNVFPIYAYDNFIIIRRSGANNSNEQFYSVYDLKGNELINENDNTDISYFNDNKLIINTLSGVKIYNVETNDYVDIDWDYEILRYSQIINDRYLVYDAPLFQSGGNDYLFDLEEYKMYDNFPTRGWVTSVLENKLALMGAGEELTVVDLSSGVSKGLGIKNPTGVFGINSFLTRATESGQIEGYFVKLK